MFKMLKQILTIQIHDKWYWAVRSISMCMGIISCVHTSSAQINRPAIPGIAFVEFQVSKPFDIKKFYEGLLGYTWPANTSAGSGNNKMYSIRVNARQSIRIQTGNDPAPDERLVALAFQTTDADSMRLYLASKKIKVPVKINMEKNGSKWFEIKDPDNHSIRFMEYPVNKLSKASIIKQGAVSSRILHAGLTISSVVAADSFYKDILGFAEIWRGGTTDSTTSWINMRIPESTDYIEYMLVNGPVSRQQLGSLHHIALLVPDIQAALDVLNDGLLPVITR